jgi:AcrR family transcriptional regulator
MNLIQSTEDRLASTPVLDRSQRAQLAKAARKEEILDAARRVFAERGFRGTTIADIAEEAGIALGTIYLYFPSKDEVFAALNQRLSEIIITATLDVPPARRLEDDIRARVRNTFVACAENRDLIRLAVLNIDPEDAVTKRLRAGEEKRAQPLVDGLKRGMDAGAVREGDPRIMAKLILGLVSNTVYQAFVLSDGTDAERFRDACSEMIIAYLTPKQ